MAFSLEDDELKSKKSRMIAALDQMSQMAQDKVAAQPETPVVGQDQQVPLDKVAGQIAPFKGQIPTTGPSINQAPAQPAPQSVAIDQQPQKKNSAVDTIKSILGYALPMAFSASRGMGILPGALGALSAQNKSDVTSNQQAIERLKEANAAELNRSRSAEESVRDKLLMTKEENDTRIREMLAGTEAQKVNQAGQTIPSEIALKEAQVQKDLKETPFESILHVLGIGKKATPIQQSQEVHAPKPGETYVKYKKRVGG